MESSQVGCLGVLAGLLGRWGKSAVLAGGEVSVYEVGNGRKWPWHRLSVVNRPVLGPSIPTTRRPDGQYCWPYSARSTSGRRCSCIQQRCLPAPRLTSRSASPMRGDTNDMRHSTRSRQRPGRTDDPRSRLGPAPFRGGGPQATTEGFSPYRLRPARAGVGGACPTPDRAQGDCSTSPTGPARSSAPGDTTGADRPPWAAACRDGGS